MVKYMFDIREPGCVPGSTSWCTTAGTSSPKVPDQADDPELFRHRQWVIEAADWIGYICERTAA